MEMEGAGWVGPKGGQMKRSLLAKHGGERKSMPSFFMQCYELFMPHFVCWKYVTLQISAEFADIHTAFL